MLLQIFFIRNQIEILNLAHVYNIFIIMKLAFPSPPLIMIFTGLYLIPFFHTNFSKVSNDHFETVFFFFFFFGGGGGGGG